MCCGVVQYLKKNTRGSIGPVSHAFTFTSLTRLLLCWYGSHLVESLIDPTPQEWGKVVPFQSRIGRKENTYTRPRCTCRWQRGYWQKFSFDGCQKTPIGLSNCLSALFIHLWHGGFFLLAFRSGPEEGFLFGWVWIVIGCQFRGTFVGGVLGQPKQGSSKDQVLYMRVKKTNQPTGV